MSEIYILSDYGKLSKKDETIVFTQPDGTNTILFPYKTEQLILIGTVSISGDVFKLLSKYKIPVIFLAKNGKFNGKLTYGESKNVFLRQKQYEILSSKENSLEVARAIVVGKIKNQISFMQRIKRKSGFDPVQEKSLQNALGAIKNTLNNAENAKEINQLRGYEGIAARTYFTVFGLNIAPEWAVFKKRSKNPPLSNVNAVLSFLYTLLSYRVESAINAEGLDPCCGNLHVINYGKSALVYDMIEEFRSPIADALCCALFNLGTLKEDDFETVRIDNSEISDSLEDENIPDSSGEEGEGEIEEKNSAVYLSKSGIKKVIKAFEEKLDTLIVYQPLNEKLSYKKIIIEQIAHYRRMILGEEKEYKSYYFK